MDTKGSKNLILDVGSGHTKIGWSDRTFPDLTYPSVVGRPILRTKAMVDGIEIKVTNS
jgi:actin-related protein 2